MKFILLLCMLFATTAALAGAKTTYHILEGKFHHGGVASVEIVDTDLSKYSVHVNYQLEKKFWVPFPNEVFHGDLIINLPPEFRDERGYLELETRERMEISDAYLKFNKRIPLKGMSDAYQIFILSKNGKSKITLTCHPSFSGTGWGEIIVTLLNPLPIINGYQIIAEPDKSVTR